MKNTDTDVIEELAALEHRQWMEWSKQVAEDGLHRERLDRWEDYWVPYDELDEDVKEHDREWARKVLEIVREEDDG